MVTAPDRSVFLEMTVRKMDGKHPCALAFLARLPAGQLALRAQGKLASRPAQQLLERRVLHAEGLGHGAVRTGSAERVDATS